MQKKNKKQTIFLFTGILFGILAVFLIIFLFFHYGPKSPPNTVPQATLERFVLSPATSTLTTVVSTTSIPVQIQENTPTPTLSPTPAWMVYDNLDLRDNDLEFLFSMRCNQDQVHLEPFNVVHYREGILESGVFTYQFDFSIAWEHLGFYGLWVHSGNAVDVGGLPFYPLQLYLENKANGYRRSPAEFQANLEDCLIGAEVRIRQDDTLSINQVVAAVRVPPPEVDEVSRRPMTLVPYLAEHYPESGFDRMEVPGLLIYTCGRQLTGEAYNASQGYWSQSRIIIGLAPTFDE